MSNAERFLTAYARIEKQMSNIVKAVKYIPYTQLLYRCSSINKVVSVNQQSLREYGELRNAIVHERGQGFEIIAEPCDSVTVDIERIADLLDVDNDILKFASSPVKTVTRETTIEDAFAMMNELNTSKIPVYEDGVYRGLVTLEEIARWGVEKNTKKKLVGDIIVSKQDEKILFVGQHNSINIAIRGYEGALQKGTRLLAIIITDKGSLNEKPLGIITLADLPKILKQYM